MTDTTPAPEAMAAILKDVTPAPWLYRPDKHDDWGWVKAQGCVIAQVRHPDRIMDEELAEWRKAKQDPWEANARFVAWARNNVEALAADLAAQKARADAAEAKVAKLVQAATWAMNHVSKLPMDEATQSEFMRHRAALTTESDNG